MFSQILLHTASFIRCGTECILPLNTEVWPPTMIHSYERGGSLAEEGNVYRSSGEIYPKDWDVEHCLFNAIRGRGHVNEHDLPRNA